LKIARPKRKEPMVMVSLRIPTRVYEFFSKNYSDNYSAEIRSLLTEYVEAQIKDGKHARV
jgi:hypothetical protein